VNLTLQRPPGFTYSSQKESRAAGRGSVPELFCEQVPLSRLAERFGTPLYVYSTATIRERVAAFFEAFRGIHHTICYSVKANSNQSILRLLSKLGCGFDVVSGGELVRVLQLGREVAGRVVFSGVGKTFAEIDFALKAGILMFNVESASELTALAARATKLKRSAQVALRVNPDVSADTHPYISTGLQKHKFGVPIADAVDLYAQASDCRFLQVAGVSVHIGSQITDPGPFQATMERLAALVQQLRHRGHRIEYVDAGGGLGIDYMGAQNFRSSIHQYAQALIPPLHESGVKLLLEPGRSIAGPAGVLLTRILCRKSNSNKRFLVVDAGMNDLIRPSLYQAEHQIAPLASRGPGVEVVDVVGPVCESGDFFARNRKLPMTEEGDLLAILDAGAYGMALASNYNSRPRPAEVLVSGKSARVVRRRETVRDLLKLET
jgi:diaminopimelate decarboxylase